MPSTDTPWLIARELPRLRRYARALRDDAGADDLVQDCVERALRKQDLWQQGSNMRAWLYRILYNLHLSGLRHAQRLPHTVPLDGCEGAWVDRGQQVARVELGELARALDTLPGDQRDVIAAVAIDGLSYEQAAFRLGISPGTVRSRLSRGRAALRETVLGAARRSPPPGRPG